MVVTQQAAESLAAFDLTIDLADCLARLNNRVVLVIPLGVIMRQILANRVAQGTDFGCRALTNCQVK